MRASRLVQLIMVLQRRGKTTARRLADELEVSVRTVYRDVEALSGIGVPIYADSGPGGGIALLDGYQTRLTGLTAPEASALGLAGIPDVAAQLGLGTVLVAAQAKVDAALPPELRQRAMRLRERFLIDVPGWFERPEEVPWLATLSEAVWEGHQIDGRYRRSDRVVARRLHPLGLVLQGTAWYLVARPGDASSTRTYRVSRFEQVIATDDLVERPGGFDLAAVWRASMTAFDRSIRAVPVEIRMPRARLGRLRSALTPGAVEEAMASVVDEPAGDDWVRMAIHAESIEVAHAELLRLGPDVEVIAPAPLRRLMCTTGEALAARHRDG